MKHCNRHASLSLLVCILSVAGVVWHTRTLAQEKTSSASNAVKQGNESDAMRANTLGVAYMNQQKFAEAQKNFEKALAVDAKFAVARLNLGVALLSQQKLEPARVALE